MKTVSLKLWNFCAIVTVGFAATGCAAEASAPTTSVEQPTSEASTDWNDEGEEEVATRRDDDLPLLAQDPGPHPGSPISRPREGLPPNPNPCPGLGDFAPQVW